MTNTNDPASVTNSLTSGPLFDLRQRAYDKKWVVWVRKSLADLRMVNRDEIESARGSAFSDDDWREYMRLPHITERSIWVTAGVFNARPSTDEVLAMLGVRNKRSEGNRAQRPRKTTKGDKAAPAREAA